MAYSCEYNNEFLEYVRVYQLLNKHSVPRIYTKTDIPLLKQENSGITFNTAGNKGEVCVII